MEWSHFRISSTDSKTKERVIHPDRGRGHPRQFRVGVCRDGYETLTLFKRRKSKIDTLLQGQNDNLESCEQVVFIYFLYMKSLASGIKY